MQRAILALALAGSAAAFVAPQVRRPGGGVNFRSGAASTGAGAFGAADRCFRVAHACCTPVRRIGGASGA